jgi:MoxR-like ATPase
MLVEVVKRVAISGFEQVEQVADIADIADIRQQFEKIHVDDAVQNYMYQWQWSQYNCSR